MNAAERSTLADEFEATRAPGLRVAEAAHRFRIACGSLEWALWATDPESHEDGGAFNHVYAAARLDEVAPEWRAARDKLRHALEQDAERVR